MFGQTTLGFGASSQPQQQNTNPNNDYNVPSAQQDTITSLRFDPQSRFLVSSSWNKQLLVWEVQQAPATGGQSTGFGSTAATQTVGQVQAQPKTQQQHSHPVLCTAWSPDSTSVFFGAVGDNTVKLWNLQTNQVTSVGQHANAVKEVFWSTQLNMVITGSWDKTIKYWDVRQSNTNAVATVDCKERIYCMDVRGALAVAATADRQLHIINLQNPQQIFKSSESPLKYQSRSVACFVDQQGFAVGGVEGRVGIVNITETATKKNFQFKCHREGTASNDVYSVNSLAFHDQQGTFSTSGSDGTYVFWDKDAKSRLKAFAKHPNAITSSVFSPNGNMFAYSLGYDWSKGHGDYQAHKLPSEIHIHPVQPAEIAKKPAAK